VVTDTRASFATSISRTFTTINDPTRNVSDASWKWGGNQKSSELDLSEAGAEMMRIADLWEVVAERFARAADSDDAAAHLASAIEPLGEIADIEQSIWEDLADLVSKSPLMGRVNP
jgi:hypothetical protein